MHRLHMAAIHHAAAAPGRAAGQATPEEGWRWGRALRKLATMSAGASERQGE
jgi:hypothetical protein